MRGNSYIVTVLFSLNATSKICRWKSAVFLRVRYIVTNVTVVEDFVRHGGYVLTGVCLTVCLSVCLLQLRIKLLIGSSWKSHQRCTLGQTSHHASNFWKSSGSRSGYKHFRRNFYHYELGEIQRILLITREVVDKSLWNFSDGWMSHWQQIMVLVRITIRIQEFLTDFLPLRDWTNCKIFASNSINNDYNVWGYELPWQRFALENDTVITAVTVKCLRYYCGDG